MAVNQHGQTITVIGGGNRSRAGFGSAHNSPNNMQRAKAIKPLNMQSGSIDLLEDGIEYDEDNNAYGDGPPQSLSNVSSVERL